ncbi:MAG: hypothetical protein AWU57_552 [Marinobacter sp. T13-3]|nr:MAG: hypothetical protein AWU57_552 [Marinobacter sp. T13-3]
MTGPGMKHSITHQRRSDRCRPAFAFCSHCSQQPLCRVDISRRTAYYGSHDRQQYEAESAMKLHHITMPVAFATLCGGIILQHDYLIAMATGYYAGVTLVSLLLGAIYAYNFARLDAYNKRLSAYRFCHTINPGFLQWTLGLTVIVLFTYAGQFLLPLTMIVALAMILAARQYMEKKAKAPAPDSHI